MSDTVTFILDAAGRYPVLKHDRQLELAYRVRAWLDWDPSSGPCPTSIEAKGRKAKARLMETNLRLVVSQAARYRYVWQSQPDLYADLIQEGVFGLNRAIEKYDPTRGYAFSTYAIAWIRQSIGRGVAYHVDTIRRPLHIHDRQRALARLIGSYEAEHGVRPPIEWLVQRSGIAEEHVRQAIVIGQMKLVSLDQSARDSAGADGSSLADLIPDRRTTSPDDQLITDHRIELANQLLESLDESEQQLIRGLYFDGLTHAECRPLIGNLSRSAVGIRKAVALDKLRTAAAEIAPDPDAALVDTVVCDQCGDHFRPTLRNRQRFCSDACRIQRRRDLHAAAKAKKRLEAQPLLIAA